MAAARIQKATNANGQVMVKSCGILLLRKLQSSFEVLLLKHNNRLDLPKGHSEEGETDIQTALREFNEETGFTTDQINLVPDFLFTSVYYPTYKRFGNTKVEKTLIIYLATLKSNASTAKLNLTEHIGYEWTPFDPLNVRPIQKNTIDPLLASLANFWKSEDGEAKILKSFE
eukprot:TRINITY_DN9312_c0_g2_i1.p1 TRINITY_DN9312_c0_g2~~TRINITY_DN9312_c0_g2_i1.p1  ORF type:complete len:172 (-),score=35.48 TRINITY_DN9312_c0_g2_i1:277-792(-)